MEDEDDEIERAIKKAEGPKDSDDDLRNEDVRPASQLKFNPLAGFLGAKKGGGADQNKNPNQFGDNSAAGKMMSLLKKGMQKKFESLKD